VADTKSERGAKTSLSGAILSEAGDLGDLPARLNAAGNLDFLRRECGGVGESYPQPIERTLKISGNTSASKNAMMPDMLWSR
jgi:hypothetical protein